MNGFKDTASGSLYQGPWALIVALILTAILYFVPFLKPLAYPFILLSTLFHEMGHGIAAVMVGGNFDALRLWANGSGAAIIEGEFGNVSRAFVAAAGLVGPALAASLFFYFIDSTKRSRLILGSLGIVLALSILLVVRNLFGFFFVALVCALCFFFSLGPAHRYAQIALAFLAGQLALSVFSRGDYLFSEYAITSAGPMPSDVAQMAEALVLPYWFWGICCALFSVAVLVFGLKRAFR